MGPLAMERSDAFTTVLNTLTKQHQEFLNRATASLGYALRKENHNLKSERDALLKEVLRLRNGHAMGNNPSFTDEPDFYDLEDDDENIEQENHISKRIDWVQDAAFAAPAPLAFNAPAAHPFTVPEPHPLNVPEPPKDCDPPRVPLPGVMGGEGAKGYSHKPMAEENQRPWSQGSSREQWLQDALEVARRRAPHDRAEGYSHKPMAEESQPPWSQGSSREQWQQGQPPVILHRDSGNQLLESQSESEEPSPRENRPRGRHAMSQSQVQQSMSSSLELRVKAARQEQEEAMFYKPTGCLAQIVFDSRFESFALALVLFNTVSIAVQTDYQARYDMAKPPLPFVLLEIGFLVFYSTEVVVRVSADASAYFLGPNRGMNIFDCGLIAMQIFELLMAFATMNSESSTNLTFLRCLRLTRAVRFTRSVHLLDTFKEVRACCVAMMMSVKPFMAACLILSLWITVISVYYTDRALSRRLWLGLDHEDVPDIRATYGTIYNSAYSLFMAISGGADWSDISTLLPGVADTILFVTYIAFSLLVLLNIITGVVISNVMKTAQDDQVACLIPSAEKVLGKVATREGHFREDISTCLSSCGVQLIATGLKGEDAGGNGEYVQLGEHNGRPFFIQRKEESWDAYVVYFDESNRWFLGPSVGEGVAVRSTESANPPKGRWPVSSEEGDYYMVMKHIQDPKRKELKALLRLMEIDEADVEAIFSLCESSKGGEVTMQSFLSMFVEARSPARRLELMQLSNDFDKNNKS